MKLPPGVLQPFEVRFFADDLHVMAFFTGHPTYESVEAMIRRNPDGAAAVRAILTRHDQSQVDHVNEQALVRAAVAGRETHFSEIEFDEPAAQPDPTRACRARVRFVSGDGERVELDVVSAGLPDAKRGGLSSPGTHARGGSLPLMVRGESALASAQSRVLIDDRPYPIPEKVRAPDYLAVDGYYTRAHHMAIIRAGEVVYEMRRAPKRIETGAEWGLATPNGERVYRIVRVGSDGTIEARRLGQIVESVTFDQSDEAVHLRRLRVADERDRTAFVELVFDRDSAFSIGVDGVAGLVRGDVVRYDDGFALRPTAPDWAVARAVNVRFARSDALHVVTTTIGAA